MEQVGRFKVIRRLGGGGFGEVWLGLDETIKREVAIKVFKPKDENLIAFATSSDTEGLDVLRARFVNEARILASLEEEPHVVNVMEFGELEDGSPYYVMPYLRRSLAELLGKDVFDAAAVEELAEPDRPRSIPLGQALTYLDQILIGLSVAHKQGLVHRDIKPSNIMLTEKNEIRLADFGIAKAPDGVHSTASSLGMGSRNYMAPEQRQSAKHVDASADIYAIGCVAYRMITGRLPEGRFSDPNVAVPELHQSLNDLIVGCLSQDKANRVADAEILLNRFRKASDQQGEIDDSTGTWVAEDGSSLRDELKPLRERIEKLLLDQGEIVGSDRKNLDALARIVDLDTEGLDALIVSVEESLYEQVRPVQNFLALIDEQIAAGDIDPESLAMAGAAIGWDQAKVDSVIRARLPKHQDDARNLLAKVGVAVVVVFLLVAGGWWIVESQQQKAEKEQSNKERIAAEQIAEITRQEGEAWEEAESINTVAAYESYKSQSFATVTRKQEAANRIDALKAESLRQAEEIRVARIAADKRAKEKAEEAEKVEAARVAADKRAEETTRRLAKKEAEADEKVRVAMIAADKRAKEKVERERLEKLRLGKLAVANSTDCVSGNCVAGFGKEKDSNGDGYEGIYEDYQSSSRAIFTWKNGALLAKEKAERERLEKLRLAKLVSARLAKEKPERERLEKLRLAKLMSVSSLGCVSGNCVSGFGIKKYSDGAFKGNRYEGSWKDGQRAGQGILYFKNGDRYEGPWWRGKRNSQGTYYWKDGSQEKQNWRDGKLLQ
jgi:serine/threonine protein kinase